MDGQPVTDGKSSLSSLCVAYDRLGRGQAAHSQLQEQEAEDWAMKRYQSSIWDEHDANMWHA